MSNSFEMCFSISWYFLFRSIKKINDILKGRGYVFMALKLWEPEFMFGGFGEI
jgi:hypothetical protein